VRSVTVLEAVYVANENPKHLIIPSDHSQPLTFRAAEGLSKGAYKTTNTDSRRDLVRTFLRDLAQLLFSGSPEISGFRCRGAFLALPPAVNIEANKYERSYLAALDTI
jgi:hypothetical protein